MRCRVKTNLVHRFLSHYCNLTSSADFSPFEYQRLFDIQWRDRSCYANPFANITLTFDDDNLGK